MFIIVNTLKHPSKSINNDYQNEPINKFFKRMKQIVLTELKV